MSAALFRQGPVLPERSAGTASLTLLVTGLPLPLPLPLRAVFAVGASPEATPWYRASPRLANRPRFDQHVHT